MQKLLRDQVYRAGGHSPYEILCEQKKPLKAKSEINEKHFAIQQNPYAKKGKFTYDVTYNLTVTYF